ncbi:MAG: hypothetical protein ACO3A4_08375 [Silvanigrellaceae bacterium]
MTTQFGYMKMKGVILASAAMLTSLSQSPVMAATLGGAISYSNKLQSTSIESRLTRFMPADRFNVGLGVRVSFFRSKGATFSTAEASEIKKNRIENVQSIELAVLSTNGMIYADYIVNPEYSLGVSVDVLGFSAGGATNLSKPANSISAKPSSFNLLVFDKYDRGTLNSHFVINRKLNKDLLVALGLAHQFVEYSSSQTFDFDNRRFRLKNDAVVLSLARDLD